MRVVFAGTPGFSLPCLQALLSADGVEVVGVVSQPDREAGRGMKLTPSPVRRAAREAGLDVITPKGLRDDPESLAWLKSKHADMLVVVAFGMILPTSWLDAPTIAPVNVHASLLPRWRGAAPIERALLAGDTETGVSIMRMEEGLDTGGVYAMRHIPIDDTATGPRLWACLSVAGSELLLGTLPEIAAGSLRPTPQDHARATYAAKIRSVDRRIDWTLPANTIDRRVRCFSPKPGARTRMDSKWLKIIRGIPLREGSTRRPGTRMDNGSLNIACARGSSYHVLEVQPEGKKVMDAEVFLHGHPVPRDQTFE